MIRTLLIANRGEIACRVAATCRRLGIRTVAVFSDADDGALHVRSCDAAVHLPGNAPADTYLRSDLLVDAARRAGADAVHPGYGFLAESAAFARAVVDAGLTWVGPPPAAIEAMGSKIEAKALMRRAGVPVLPDSSVEGAADLAAIGFPMLVKASAGGGGRGHARRHVGRRPRRRPRRRRARGRGGVRRRHRVLRALRRARPPRRGAGVRRHRRQRRGAARAGVLDPAPAPEDRRGVAVTGRRRRRCGPAWRMRRSPPPRPSTTSAPAPSSSCSTRPAEFWFLEMNTRLQVEHPVTEAVTGLDLVAAQLAHRRRRDGRRGRPRPATGGPRHRGPPHGRGPRRRLPPVDRDVRPFRRRRRRRARRHRHRGGLDGLAVLRLDGRQGHRPRRRPGTRRSAASTPGSRAPSCTGR